MSDEKNTISNFSMEGILNHYSNIIKRLIWVIVFESVLVVATIFGFLWYISLPVEETSSIDQKADGSSYNQIIGGDYNGSTAESDNL